MSGSMERRGIGKYRFIGRIGAGGMAEVFLAVQEGPARFRKLIAVKVLRSQFADMAEGREMFLNEARLAARLSHPNVVSVLEVGAEGGDLFIAMEYLKGQSLSRVLSRSPRAAEDSPTTPVLLRILSDALAGVHHAHEAQEFDGTPLRLVHRDLTPQNIFVTYEGNVKVLDFGIAKAVSSTNETRAGMIKGKIPFMCAEQLTGEATIDRRVDIYSMGCCLWQMLTGIRPFKGLSDLDALEYIATRGLPPVRESAPNVPAELERICARATAFDRNDRYPDAAEFQADIDAYIARHGDASMRLVSKHVTDLFEEESSRVQQLIEAALSRPIDTASLPAFSLPGTRENSAARSLPSVSPPGAAQTLPPPQLPPAAPGSRIAWAGLALGATAALIAGAFALRFPASHTTAGPAQNPGTAAPRASVAPVRLKLSARPPEARMFLDGASIATNPVDFTLPGDGSRHMLRAEAEGYFDRVLELTLDGDKEVVLTLEKVPSKASKPGPPVVAAVVPASQPGAKAVTPANPTATGAQDQILPPPAAKKPQRQLDVDNPFDKK